MAIECDTPDVCPQTTTEMEVDMGRAMTRTVMVCPTCRKEEETGEEPTDQGVGAEEAPAAEQAPEAVTGDPVEAA